MTLESTLQDADVANIWAPEAEYALVAPPRAVPCALEPSGKPYALLTLTDGKHKAEALAFPKSNLARAAPGQRVRLLRHRVQWTNGRRQWFIFEGSVQDPESGGRPLPDISTLAPVPHPPPVLPAAARPPRKKKASRAAAGQKRKREVQSPPPFILGCGGAAAAAAAAPPRASSRTAAAAEAAPRARHHPFSLSS